MRRFFNWEILHLDCSRNKTSQIFGNFDIFASPFVFWAQNKTQKWGALIYFAIPNQFGNCSRSPCLSKDLILFHLTSLINVKAWINVHSFFSVIKKIGIVFILINSSDSQKLSLKYDTQKGKNIKKDDRSILTET